MALKEASLSLWLSRFADDIDVPGELSPAMCLEGQRKYRREHVGAGRGGLGMPPIKSKLGLEPLEPNTTWGISKPLLPLPLVPYDSPVFPPMNRRQGETWVVESDKGWQSSRVLNVDEGDGGQPSSR